MNDQYLYSWIHAIDFYLNSLEHKTIGKYPCKPRIMKTYWPKERNTSKLSNYQLNKLRKCQETTQE